MEANVRIQFLHRYGTYNVGEKAWFSPSIAKMLTEGEVPYAKVVKADEKKVIDKNIQPVAKKSYFVKKNKKS